MGYKAIGRKIIENRDSFVLRKPQVLYQSVPDGEIGMQPEDNTIYRQNGPESNLCSNMRLARISHEEFILFIKTRKNLFIINVLY